MIPPHASRADVTSYTDLYPFNILFLLFISSEISVTRTLATWLGTVNNLIDFLLLQRILIDGPFTSGAATGNTSSIVCFILNRLKLPGVLEKELSVSLVKL